MRAGNRTRRVSLGCLATVTAGLLFGSPAVAQDAGKDMRWRFEGFGGFEYQSETDLSGSNGDFEYFMPNFGMTASKPLSDAWILTLNGDHRVINYDFDIPGGFEPWETIHVARVSPLMTYVVDETWSIHAGPMLEFSGESGADLADSLRGGGAFAVAYKGDGFLIKLGLLVVNEIEDDTYIQPIGMVELGDRLHVKLQGNSTRGGELRVGYTFLERFTISGGYGFRRERFRLDDDGAPGLREDGVGEERSQLVKLTFSYAFTEKMALDFYWGTTLKGEFRLENEKGKKLADSDYDDSSFGGVLFRFAF